MTTATRIALSRLRARHGAGSVVALLLVIFCGAAAFAYWTTTGAGSGAAAAATLPAPTGVTVSATGSTVSVSWTGVTPPAGTLNGYYVTRYLGATASNACGTSPTTPVLIPAGTVTCSDTAVPNGTYTYTVSAVFRSWTATSTASASVTVNADATPPTQVVSLAATGNTAYLSGTNVYFRSDIAGSFTLTDVVTDAGSGPASANFPAIAATNWTHTALLQTTGTGTNPKTYVSNTYSWTAGAATPTTHTVTGKDVQGNSVTTNLTFVPDTTGPTGGALVVAGTTATAGGATAYSTTGTFTGTRTNYSTDAASGFKSSTLTREVGTLSNGLCSAYGAATTVAAAPSETTVATGCYRYTLTGLDQLDNPSVLTTIVQVDTVAPTQVLSAAGNGSVAGALLYYRSGVAGSFTLASTVTDNESGPLSVQFPLMPAGWNHTTAETITPGTGTNPTKTFLATTYTWAAANPTAPGAKGFIATDLAGKTGTTTLTFTADTAVPTGGALTVNGGVASAGGGTTYNGDQTAGYTISRTDYTDALSGVAAGDSELTRQFGTLNNGLCGAFGAATVLTGTPTETGLAQGCYKYTLTGTDRVGNATSVTTTVQVDLTDPTQAITMTGGAGFALLSGNTVYFKPTGTGSFTLTSTLTDPGAGPLSVNFPAISGTNWTHANQTVTPGTGTDPTKTYTSANFTLAAGVSGTPADYTITGTDDAGNTVTTTLTFVPDTTGPTGGALNVNGAVGTASGAVGYSTTGTFTGTFTNYSADTESGYASTTLLRSTATLTNGVCGAFGAGVADAAISETNVAAGCYRWTLTGLDAFGNASSLISTIQVDKTVPSAVTVALANGVNASQTGNVIYYRGNVAGSFTLNATVTDNGSSPASATFPALTATNWTTRAAQVQTTPLSGVAPTITYASSLFDWVATAAAPGSYTVSGQDAAGWSTNAAALTFTSDTTGPTGGALTVNGTAATAGGSTSTATSNTWTIGTRTDYSADAASGFLSSVLTREGAPYTNAGCGTYDGVLTTVTGTTAQTGLVGGKCYRYVLTGTDKVGNTTTLTTVVRAPVVVSSVVLANGTTGTAGTLNRTDTITVQYSGPIAVNSLCSTWSGDTTNQSIAADNVVGVRISEGTGGANDYITIENTNAVCGGTNAFKFGTLTLGNDTYLQSTTTQLFRGAGAGNRSTITYNASTYTLVITLGTNETTPGDDGSNAVTANTTAIYTPNLGLLGSPGGAGTGVPIIGFTTATTTNTATARQF